jgi:hypothetical protein
VRKARSYFIASDKHVFYGRVAWPEHNAFSIHNNAFAIQLVRSPDPIAVCEALVVPAYGAVRRVSAGTESPRVTTGEYVKTVSKLIELLELPGGWNSYNAKPISKENVTFAVALLGRLMRESTPAPLVVPKVRGGVQLEWHTRGIDIEVTIDSPERVSFLAEDLRGGQELAEGPINERVLGTWIEKLSG